MTTDSDWTTATATDHIREIARSRHLKITYREHARERLAERDLIMSDALFVLKNGFVHVASEPSTRPGFNKYCMECRSPNSNGRDVRIVVIPDKKQCWLKIVTVMWVDEKPARAGTIIGSEEDNE